MNPAPPATTIPGPVHVTTTRTLTLGQLAYEAYCGHADWKSVITGMALPPWSQARDDVKAAWEAAANAVSQVVRCGDKTQDSQCCCDKSDIA